MTGIATFHQKTLYTFHYHEKCDFFYYDQAFNATCNYLYQYNNETISIWFDEQKPRLFTLLSLNDNIATGQHRCSEDNYDIEFHFLNSNCFTLRIKVTGPKKDYTIHTQFIREIL